MIEQLKATRGTSPEQREQSLKDLMTSHQVISDAMADLISKLGASLLELGTYLPVWRASIEKRRCLMLSRNPAEIPPPSGRFTPRRRIR